MKKLNLLLIIMLLLLFANGLKAQNLNQNIRLVLTGYSYSSRGATLYEQATLILYNYSSYCISVNKFYVFKSQEEGPFYNVDGADQIYPDNGSTYTPSYNHQSSSPYLKMGEWFVEVVYTNLNDYHQYTKKFKKKANYFSTDMELEEVSENGSNPDEHASEINGHEFVDLGLPSGALWAKTNYGASSEGDYGIYMNWQSRSLIQSVWGEEWSTPSWDDIYELQNYCRFMWEYNSDSVYGCRVMGPNDNSIFLPAAGFKIQGTPQMVGSTIYYWSDDEYEPGFAYALQGSDDMGTNIYETFNVDYAMFPIRPVANGSKSGGEEDDTHDFVDLALPSGLLWATANVGAKRPEKVGSFFAWGETSPKREYDWASYKYANGSETTLTKYCDDSSYGDVDYKSVLEEQDDAATANWGKPWRTPTLSETQELISYCSWVLTTHNGVSGYKVTGANGNSIFLPAGGVMQNSWVYFTERAVVMSASLFSYCSSASVLNCQDGAPYWWYGWSRCWGYPVRPVTSRDPSGIINPSEMESHEIIGIYDLRGHKLDGLGKGFNIIKYKDGSSKKIVK